jgi:8-oxo-dGTP pyrophosphatase MutT (NUDIX family)
MAELPPPIPAATLILMRPSSCGGAPEILMLERTLTMAFAAGALVFPGGKVDPEDHQAAAAWGSVLEDAPARIAAIRETIEESGIATGLSPQPGAETALALRAGLAAGQGLAALAESHGLSADLDVLLPFARWCPNFAETRRFDTMFYLAEAPAGAEASAHAPEAERLFWASASAVLADVEAGRSHAIFPTRRNLERLAQFGSLEEARDQARAFPIQRITPWIEQRDGRDWLCIPDDLGYPVTAQLLAEVKRS